MQPGIECRTILAADVDREVLEMEKTRIDGVSGRLGGVSTLLLALSECPEAGEDTGNALRVLADEVEDVRECLLMASEANSGQELT